MIRRSSDCKCSHCKYCTKQKNQKPNQPTCLRTYITSTSRVVVKSSWLPRHIGRGLFSCFLVTFPHCSAQRRSEMLCRTRACVATVSRRARRPNNAQRVLQQRQRRRMMWDSSFVRVRPQWDINLQDAFTERMNSMANTAVYLFVCLFVFFSLYPPSVSQ
jgi:hypothetical protein